MLSQLDGNVKINQNIPNYLLGRIVNVADNVTEIISLDSAIVSGQRSIPGRLSQSPYYHLAHVGIDLPAGGSSVSDPCIQVSLPRNLSKYHKKITFFLRRITGHG